VGIALESGYGRLPERFYARLSPTAVAKPRLIAFNHTLASELGLDVSGLDAQALARIFSGNELPPGADPLATAYAGHQFGSFVAQLGDGRAILLGEVRDLNGARREIQLKGAGRTPYSRGGDGRAALGPVLREYLVSEAMYALGIPGTRALAAALSGEEVFREARLPGAVFTRVAASHVRVGTFQFFAARGDLEAVQLLANFVIERHYPEIRGAASPYAALLDAVIDRQASLVSRWMGVGFIHGVMNTDNMTLSGETIDFGPCAFMDEYDPATVFSSIDSRGRYSYANQPHAAQWDLARLAEALLSLLDPTPEKALEIANTAIAAFPRKFADHWLSLMRRKLGLHTAEESDLSLVEGLLELMHSHRCDFTLTFRELCDVAVGAGAGAGPLDDWIAAWRVRLSREPLDPAVRRVAMRSVNPRFIPRNHRIEQVIRAAVDATDFEPFMRLSTVLSRPFEDQPAFEEYAKPPQPAERVLQTFCGT
jgi:uncharacterized protein YdiU (UPF0061 family)